MNTEQWTPPQRELWARLHNFDLDEPGASLDFSRRLARENGWTHDFARRIVEEYKRFLFLAMNAGHPVTPSDEVDQAWHLHLVYTRSYWDELCADVLRVPLHHGPTRGGARESAKFGQWYAQTRASYARFFGEEAPPDIWPDAQIRFGDAPHFRRVNARRHWIVGKPDFPWPTRLSPALLVVLSLLGAGGVAAGAQVNLNPWNWGGAAFLTLFWSLCVAGIFAVLWVRREWALPADPLPPDVRLDAYALTRLQNGGEMPIDAAIANMMLNGQISIDKDRRVVRSGLPPTAPWERIIWDKLAAGPRELRLLRGELKPKLPQFDAELQRLGLLIAPQQRENIQLVTVAVSVGLLLLGGSKILVGLGRERPVGFLVISCVLVLVMFGVAMATAPRCSRRGAALLETLRQRHGRGSLSLPAQFGASSSAPLAGGIVLGMALWGYSEMDAFGLSQQRLILRPPASSDGGGGGSGYSDGGGSGCGGGGCGGGGCGGCGG